MKAASVPRSVQRRLGPRPLPLHLAAATLTWVSSRAALPLLRNGSLPWRPHLAAAAGELQRHLANANLDAFARALEAELHRRLAALLKGIQTYRNHPYRRSIVDPPVVWQAGTTRLLDYGIPGTVGGRDPQSRPAVLVVPSLINRAYILDLSEERSLLRYLAGQGFRPLLVDWGRPGPEERGFALTDYIAGRLEAVLDAVLGSAGPRPLVIGYCMGGLLALALALRRQRDLSGLALLATPWDFQAGQEARAHLLAATFLPSLNPLLETLGELPVGMIQLLFAALDPQVVARKYVAFSHLDPNGREASAFVALEDWVNDGTPLTAPVARECLVGWYGDNTPARGRWTIAGRPVRPGDLRLPALCLIPARDRIVPPRSATALADALPHAKRLVLPLGHIGMVVSNRAREQVWAPLADWLHACSAQPIG